MHRKEGTETSKLTNATDNDFSLITKQENAYLDTRIQDNETLYDALDRKGLLYKSNVAVSTRLIEQGHIGMSLHNGKAMFLGVGRHTLWSAYHQFVGKAPINQKVITHSGIVEIVTIDQGELGLSTYPGKNIILKPGQHILQAPHKFVKAEKTNRNYVNLGTYHRITVPLGMVAIAEENGKKIIISPTDFKIDKQHRPYFHCTNGSMYEIDSDTFKFDPATGFKSVQLEDVVIPTQTVNTMEMLELEVSSSVRYQIDNPVLAFLNTKNVDEDLKTQANATLTSVFAQLAVNKISNSLYSLGTNHKDKQEANDLPEDMVHQATVFFMKEFSSIVSQWGVHTQNISIVQVRLKNAAYQNAVLARTQQAIQAISALAVVEQETETQKKIAAREAEVTRVKAEAEANKMKTLAEAEAQKNITLAQSLVKVAEAKAEAAKILSAHPLARDLTHGEIQERNLRALGDKTVIFGGGLGLFSQRINDKQTMLINAMDREEQLSDVKKSEMKI